MEEDEMEFENSVDSLRKFMARKPTEDERMDFASDTMDASISSSNEIALLLGHLKEMNKELNNRVNFKKKKLNQLKLEEENVEMSVRKLQQELDAKNAQLTELIGECSKVDLEIEKWREEKMPDSIPSSRDQMLLDKARRLKKAYQTLLKLRWINVPKTRQEPLRCFVFSEETCDLNLVEAETSDILWTEIGKVAHPLWRQISIKREEKSN